MNQKKQLPTIRMMINKKFQGNAIISGCIPDYNSVNKPPMIISTSDITDAYDEITTWKNVFLVPYGKTGRDFIDQITMHINY